MKSDCIQHSHSHWLVVAIATTMILPMAGKAETATQDRQPSIVWSADLDMALLTNGRLEIVVETHSGVNARTLRDVASGQVYADRDYAWSSGGKLGLPKMDDAPVISDSNDGGRRIAFKGRLGAIAVEQVFTLP